MDGSAGRVAVIGAGPSGLHTAQPLRKDGPVLDTPHEHPRPLEPGSGLPTVWPTGWWLTETGPTSSAPSTIQRGRPEHFAVLYSSTPPWDIGRPQPAFQALADRGAITGRVLDVGCGTGEHVLMTAALGLDATGVDLAEAAIDTAQEKARQRGLTARFLVWDTLRLAELNESFDTVIDSGLFHIFSDEDRAPFVDSLSAVVRPGGRYFMLCFSEHQPGDWGPRRVTQDEIRANFTDGWQINSIERAQFLVTFDPNGARAWLATITRT